MTITYQSKVTSASSCAFGKLLGKWKGSIYKLVYKELVFYGFCYAVISLTYRHLLATKEKRMFEKICLWVEDTVDMIPLTFVLGFYVSFVVQRWWDQFLNIPWPDRVTAAIALYVEGKDEGGRLIRRTMARYLNLSFILVAQSVSVAVRKRFPTILHLEETGLLTHEETETLRNLSSESNKYWVPISWLIAVLRTAKKEGRIKDPLGSKAILEEVNTFRKHTATLWCYDWVSVPLVYTQVVTWATHLFFIACLFGRQILDPEQDYGSQLGRRQPKVDVYVPVFTLLQFLFYMGWLKVAEQLINPFGEDDDDLEINYLIDRHLQVSYLAVDELFDTHPELVKDQFWSEENPVRLPYSASTLRYRKKSYLGSAWDIRLNEDSNPVQHLVKIPEESSEYEMHSLLKNAQSMPYLLDHNGLKDNGYSRRMKNMGSNNNLDAEKERIKKTSTASMVNSSPAGASAVVRDTYHGTHDADHHGDHQGFVHGRWSVAASHLLTMWRKISMSRSASEAMCSPPDVSQLPHHAHHDVDVNSSNTNNCDSLETVISTSSDRYGHINNKEGKVVIDVDEGPASGNEDGDTASVVVTRQRATSALAPGVINKSVLGLRNDNGDKSQETPPMKRIGIRRKYSIQHGATDRQCSGPWLYATKKVSFPALPSVSPIPERATFADRNSFRHMDDLTSSDESEHDDHQAT